MSLWTTEFVYYLRACLLVQTEQFLDNFAILFSRLFVSIFAGMLAHDYRIVEKVLDKQNLLTVEYVTSNLRVLIMRLLDPLDISGKL